MDQSKSAPPQLDAADGASEMPWRTGTKSLSQLAAGAKSVRRKPTRYRFTNCHGHTVEQSFAGRKAWTLDRLIGAGPSGLTAAECPPGVRLAAHIADLRARGVPIRKTVETHGGPFPGHHARYRLAAQVERIGGDA